MSLLVYGTCPRLLCSRGHSNISLTLPFNACVCLLCHAVLHLDANAAHHVVSLPAALVDIRSTVIPVDDEEEEEEETYDDIEGMTGPPPPRPGAARPAESSKWRGGHEPGEVDDEDEDIYEVLPGMRMWLPHMRTHTQTLMILSQTNSRSASHTHAPALRDFCSKKYL